MAGAEQLRLCFLPHPLFFKTACRGTLETRLVQAALPDRVRAHHHHAGRSSSTSPSASVSLCVRPLPLSILIPTLTYTVQGHCYNVFEIIGCLSETYETPSPSSSSTSPHPHRRRLRRLIWCVPFPSSLFTPR
jgi:hypothetical protein